MLTLKERLYEYIKKNSKHDKIYIKADSTLLKLLNEKSRYTIYNALDKLENEGLITTENRGPDGTLVYFRNSANVELNPIIAQSPTNVTEFSNIQNIVNLCSGLSLQELEFLRDNINLWISFKKKD